MKHTYFEVRNFKGINHIRLAFTDHPQSKIYTLVGLNESGKTTILEALDFFSPKRDSEKLSPLNLPGYSVKDVHELIPIGKRSNFNESIVLEAGYQLDADDYEAIRDYARATLKFEISEVTMDFSITQSYKFRDSKLLPDQPTTMWSIAFTGRPLTATGKPSRSKAESKLDGVNWQSALKFVRTLLPTILYFPNFLFEFPDRIYLEDTETNPDPEKHKLYRSILQDVLDSMGEGLSLERHVLARAKSSDRPDKKSLESVLLKMGTNITRTVFENWNRILKREAGNREIKVEWDVDEVGYYIQLTLKDSNELFAISERSLGFRWFFAFLLLTTYRGFRQGAPKHVLFLFDEPASNLHSSAQTRLLESFGKFPSSCAIVYATHSHHMINPAWLEGTFVVRNEGLEYDSEDEFSAKDTIVTLEKYRAFAAQHPNQSTYFQPVLDVLDYSPGKLENVPDVVMVEGKNDFYTLKYFQARILGRSKELNLMPGGGSGSLDAVIRLYLAWGRDFIVLLDGDKEGSKQKQRYEKLFGTLVKDRIFSFEDVDPSWKKKGMEYIIDEADRLAIQRAAYPSSSDYDKDHFNRAVQELYLTKHVVSVSDSTKHNLERILDFCAAQFPF